MPILVIYFIVIPLLVYILARLWWMGGMRAVLLQWRLLLMIAYSGAVYSLFSGITNWGVCMCVCEHICFVFEGECVLMLVYTLSNEKETIMETWMMYLPDLFICHNMIYASQPYVTLSRTCLTHMSHAHVWCTCFFCSILSGPENKYRWLLWILHQM